MRILLGAVIGGFVMFIVMPIFLAWNIGPGEMMNRNQNQNNQAQMMAGNIDQHFIEQMIPHHEGAIEMANLALQKSERPEIISLSNAIIEAQESEINKMKSWYLEWFDKEVGDSSFGHHGMHNMAGMEGDLIALEQAENFDIEFINQMIVHHEMAVMMASMLESSTERDEMEKLADQIITSQSKEIEMMKSWRKEWSLEEVEDEIEE